MGVWSSPTDLVIQYNLKSCLMITALHPKLPMRNKEITRSYYTDQLGFTTIGDQEYEEYLMVERDGQQMHFFLFKELDPLENYGQVYFRTDRIDDLYRSFLDRGIKIHPQGHLSDRPGGQREFHLLDPDHNLLTFGQRIC